jgi:hypothetical protein
MASTQRSARFKRGWSRDRGLDTAVRRWRPLPAGETWSQAGIDALRKQKVVALLDLRNVRANIERSLDEVSALELQNSIQHGWHPLRARWLERVSARLNQKTAEMARIRNQLRGTSQIWAIAKASPGFDAESNRINEVVLADELQHQGALNNYVDELLTIERWSRILVGDLSLQID